MSDQPPLVPPTPQSGPGYEPYSAPAYGESGPQPPQGPPPPPGPAAPYQVAPQFLVNPAAPTHPLAITSLVLGIIGIVSIILTPFVLITFIGGVCSPFAIWLGARAKREIRANPQAHGGEGVAIGGFVTGIVGLVLGILALLAVLVFVVFIVWIFSAATV